MITSAVKQLISIKHIPNLFFFYNIYLCILYIFIMCVCIYKYKHMHVNI